jgi:hypothetical protein
MPRTAPYCKIHLTSTLPILQEHQGALVSQTVAELCPLNLVSGTHFLYRQAEFLLASPAAMPSGNARMT